jgi:hypothetical protein
MLGGDAEVLIDFSDRGEVKTGEGNGNGVFSARCG